MAVADHGAHISYLLSLETLNLARSNGWFAAGTNVVASVSLCLSAVALGYWLATALQR